MNILITIPMLILLVHMSQEQQAKDDLMAIATAFKSINRTANEVEKYILNHVDIIDTFNRYVNFEMGFIHSRLPVQQYHVQFFQRNNIDKNYLGHLVLEANYAMSFYYNSINDVLNMNDIYGFTTDSWLKQIQRDLRYDVICRYRSVLNVYSYEWRTGKDIGRVEFSRGKYRIEPSLVHDVHTIIIVRLLRQWMRTLHSVILNLEKKML